MVLIYPLAMISAGWTAANQAVVVSLLFRCGLLMLATALALPQLRAIARRMSSFVGWVLIAVALIIVVRPRLVPLAIGAGLLAIAIHFGLRFGSDFLSKRRA
jgi:hypothetical protein